MDRDQVFLKSVLARIHLFIAFLTIAGFAAAAVRGGWKWSAGFFLGAAASWFNFRWLRQMVSSLGQAASGKRPGVRGAVLFGLRYLLLAAGGYVILNFTTLSLTAGLVGLFVPAAAVILEILYELIYVRT